MSGRKKTRILCVSRSAYQLRALRGAFPSREYEVLSAISPEQAVAVCVSNHISAVVLDSEFSTESGWSAAHTLKMLNPQLPVMLLLKNGNKPFPAEWMP
jgi:DNA-binding NtrC family response regulator